MSRRGLGLLALLLGATSPPRLSAQCPDGSPPPCRPAVRSVAPAQNSIAVLYFDNLSPDTADAYLADGLTDEIIARLGQLERLHVKSRTAVRRYRSSTDDAATLGRALGAAHLVNGTVRRAGNHLRVTIELLHAATGDRVWGDVYDRGDTNLLDIETDIARAVATAIAGKLAPPERASLAARLTRSPAAYDHFLRGNYALAQRTGASLTRAIAEYQAALRLDSTFTSALSHIAFAYALNLAYVRGLPAESLLARGRASADRALQRDSASSDAWVARGLLSVFGDPSIRGVREALDRAIALDPENAEAQHQYGATLLRLGDDSAAEAGYRRALAIEPERAITLSALGLLSFLERRYDDSRRWLDSSLRVDPEFYLAYVRRARTRLMLADAAGARADAEIALRLGGADSSLGQALLVMASIQTGDTVTARGLASRRLRASPDTIWEAILEEQLLPAAALVTLGDREGALSFLEHVRPRGVRFWSGLRAPEFDPLRTEPRFQRLVDESRPR